MEASFGFACTKTQTLNQNNVLFGKVCHPIGVGSGKVYTFHADFKHLKISHIVE